MIYQLKSQFFIKDRKRAEKVYEMLSLLFSDSEVINAFELNEEYSYIELNECHHDEKPVSPCSNLRRDSNTTRLD